MSRENECCEKCWQSSTAYVSKFKFGFCIQATCECHRIKECVRNAALDYLIKGYSRYPYRKDEEVQVYPEVAECAYSPEVAEKWEKEFDKQFLSFPIKTFITKEIAKARSQGRIEEAVRCVEHEKKARNDERELILAQWNKTELTAEGLKAFSDFINSRA